MSVPSLIATTHHEEQVRSLLDQVTQLNEKVALKRTSEAHALRELRQVDSDVAIVCDAVSMMLEKLRGIRRDMAVRSTEGAEDLLLPRRGTDEDGDDAHGGLYSAGRTPSPTTTALLRSSVTAVDVIESIKHRVKITADATDECCGVIDRMQSDWHQWSVQRRLREAHEGEETMTSPLTHSTSTQQPAAPLPSQTPTRIEGHHRPLMRMETPPPATSSHAMVSLSDCFSMIGRLLDLTDTNGTAKAERHLAAALDSLHASSSSRPMPDVCFDTTLSLRTELTERIINMSKEVQRLKTDYTIVEQSAQEYSHTANALLANLGCVSLSFSDVSTAVRCRLLGKTQRGGGGDGGGGGVDDSRDETTAHSAWIVTDIASRLDALRLTLDHHLETNDFTVQSDPLEVLTSHHRRPTSHSTTAFSVASPLRDTKCDSRSVGVRRFIHGLLESLERSTVDVIAAMERGKTFCGECLSTAERCMGTTTTTTATTAHHTASSLPLLSLHQRMQQIKDVESTLHQRLASLLPELPSHARAMIMPRTSTLASSTTSDADYRVGPFSPLLSIDSMLDAIALALRTANSVVVGGPRSTGSGGATTATSSSTAVNKEDNRDSDDASPPCASYISSAVLSHVIHLLDNAWQFSLSAEEASSATARAIGHGSDVGGHLAGDAKCLRRIWDQVIQHCHIPSLRATRRHHHRDGGGDGGDADANDAEGEDGNATNDNDAPSETLQEAVERMDLRMGKVRRVVSKALLILAAQSGVNGTLLHNVFDAVNHHHGVGSGVGGEGLTASRRGLVQLRAMLDHIERCCGSEAAPAAAASIVSTGPEEILKEVLRASSATCDRKVVNPPWMQSLFQTGVAAMTTRHRNRDGGLDEQEAEEVTLNEVVAFLKRGLQSLENLGEAATLPSTRSPTTTTTDEDGDEMKQRFAACANHLRQEKSRCRDVRLALQRAHGSIASILLADSKHQEAQSDGGDFAVEQQKFDIGPDGLADPPALIAAVEQVIERIRQHHGRMWSTLHSERIRIDNLNETTKSLKKKITSVRTDATALAKCLGFSGGAGIGPSLTAPPSASCGGGGGGGSSLVDDLDATRQLLRWTLSTAQAASGSHEGTTDTDGKKMQTPIPGMGGGGGGPSSQQQQVVHNSKALFNLQFALEHMSQRFAAVSRDRRSVRFNLKEGSERLKRMWLNLSSTLDNLTAEGADADSVSRVKPAGQGESGLKELDPDKLPEAALRTLFPDVSLAEAVNMVSENHAQLVMLKRQQAEKSRKKRLAVSAEGCAADPREADDFSDDDDDEDDDDEAAEAIKATAADIDEALFFHRLVLLRDRLMHLDTETLRINSKLKTVSEVLAKVFETSLAPARAEILDGSLDDLVTSMGHMADALLHHVAALHPPSSTSSSATTATASSSATRFAARAVADGGNPSPQRRPPPPPIHVNSVLSRSSAEDTYLNTSGPTTPIVSPQRAAADPAAVMIPPAMLDASDDASAAGSGGAAVSAATSCDHRLLRIGKSVQHMFTTLTGIQAVKYFSPSGDVPDPEVLNRAVRSLVALLQPSAPPDATTHDAVVMALEGAITVAERTLDTFALGYKQAALAVQRDVDNMQTTLSATLHWWLNNCSLSRIGGSVRAREILDVANQTSVERRPLQRGMYFCCLSSGGAAGGGGDATGGAVLSHQDGGGAGGDQAAQPAPPLWVRATHMVKWLAPHTMKQTLSDMFAIEDSIRAMYEDFVLPTTVSHEDPRRAGGGGGGGPSSTQLGGLLHGEGAPALSDLSDEEGESGENHEKNNHDDAAVGGTAVADDADNHGGSSRRAVASSASSRRIRAVWRQFISDMHDVRKRMEGRRVEPQATAQEEAAVAAGGDGLGEDYAVADFADDVNTAVKWLGCLSSTLLKLAADNERLAQERRTSRTWKEEALGRRQAERKLELERDTAASAAALCRARVAELVRSQQQQQPSTRASSAPPPPSPAAAAQLSKQVPLQRTLSDGGTSSAIGSSARAAAPYERPTLRSTLRTKSATPVKRPPPTRRSSLPSQLPQKWGAAGGSARGSTDSSVVDQLGAPAAGGGGGVGSAPSTPLSPPRVPLSVLDATVSPLSTRRNAPASGDALQDAFFHSSVLRHWKAVLEGEITDRHLHSPDTARRHGKRSSGLAASESSSSNRSARRRSNDSAPSTPLSRHMSATSAGSSRTPPRVAELRPDRALVVSTFGMRRAPLDMWVVTPTGGDTAAAKTTTSTTTTEIKKPLFISKSAELDFFRRKKVEKVVSALRQEPAALRDAAAEALQNFTAALAVASSRSRSGHPHPKR